MRWRARQRRHPLGWTLSVGAREPVRTARTKLCVVLRALVPLRRTGAFVRTSTRSVARVTLEICLRTSSKTLPASHEAHRILVTPRCSSKTRHGIQNATFCAFFLLAIRFWCFVFLFRTSTDKMASCPNEVQTRGEGYENATS